MLRASVPNSQALILRRIPLSIPLPFCSSQPLFDLITLGLRTLKHAECGRLLSGLLELPRLRTR